MSSKNFDRSPELKSLFNSYYEKWRKNHGGNMEELARRIGVSSSYLGHISRYGRVPGKRWSRYHHFSHYGC